MPIRRIKVRGVRNLKPLELELSSGVNFIYGANGSGKTSVLEAIVLMATGKSFRTSQVKNIIALEADRIEMQFDLEDDTLGQCQLDNLRLRAGEHLLKLNGSVLTAQSEATHWLPVQIIEPTTFKLLTGSPEDRRQFLDWGVFHVEQSFISHWKVFKKQLQQRNAVLKQQEPSWLGTWNAGFIESAEAIDAMRRNYMSRFIPVFDEILKRLDPQLSISINYYPGWDREAKLADVLARQQERDLVLGYTQSGPHRAELRIKVDKLPAAEILSRGQQKTVVSALKLAQGSMFQSETGRKTIYLVDDLTSELDEQHRLALCTLLQELDCQVFITSIEKDKVTNLWRGEHSQVFYLADGQIAED